MIAWAKHNRIVLILFLVLFVEAIALAWLNDYASCDRSNEVRRTYNTHLSKARGIPLLACTSLIPGT